MVVGTIEHMNGEWVAEAVRAVDEATRRFCGGPRVADAPGCRPAAGGGSDTAGGSDEVGSVAEWVDVIAQSQAMINQLTAVQAAAIARVAATESVHAEDGTIEERSRGVGHVRIDAASLVAGPLGVTDAAAQRRVSLAVREVAVMHSLHEAMASGTLDGWRAALVGEELLDAPDAVAGVVATLVIDQLAGRSGADVRRRVRCAVAAVDEQWLRQRTERARRDRSVRRWAHEPGVDAWFGTFPAERSGVAWAAVDDLAQRYRKDGDCETLDQARADAMLDLILGRATARFIVQLTVPAATGAARDSAGVAAATSAADTAATSAADTVAPSAADTAARGIAPTADANITHSAAGSAALAADVLRWLRDRDGFLEMRGLGGSGTSEVPAAWIAERISIASAQPHGGGADGPIGVIASHPMSDALLDPEDALRGEAYRPGVALTRFVRARDGHCRFPGCTATARFCDLDHVRPWPIGATCASNLVLLCRRHHRVKQSPGWQAMLRRDGSMLWCTPDGRSLTSEAIDHRQPTRCLPPQPAHEFASQSSETESLEGSESSGSEWSGLEWSGSQGSSPGCERVSERVALQGAPVRSALPHPPAVPA